MNRLILITGDIAAGKSSFSNSLAERYGIECYNKDSFKELLADCIGFSNREENLKLSRAAVRIMTHIFEKKAALEESLILEANFHEDELAGIYEIAANYGVEILLLELEADTTVLYDRFRHRIEKENRHIAHQTAGLNSLEAFEEYVCNARKATENYQCVSVDAGDFSYQTDPGLLAIIDDFMEAAIV